MCPHPFIGCAVVVVVVGEDELEAVGMEDGVALVLCHEAQQLPSANLASRKACSRRLHGVEDSEGGVGMVVDEGLRHIKCGTLLPIAQTGSENDGGEDNV